MRPLRATAGGFYQTPMGSRDHVECRRTVGLEPRDGSLMRPPIAPRVPARWQGPPAAAIVRAPCRRTTSSLWTRH